jgi:hypothetical protein
VERGWITRQQARDRTLATLEFFRNAPRGPEPSGRTGDRGFFYHFLDMETGQRFKDTELSTIDTMLLLAGALFSQSYFDRDHPSERRIRELAEELYRRAEWPLFQQHSHRFDDRELPLGADLDRDEAECAHHSRSPPGRISRRLARLRPQSIVAANALSSGPDGKGFCTCAKPSSRAQTLPQPAKRSRQRSQSRRIEPFTGSDTGHSGIFRDFSSCQETRPVNNYLQTNPNFPKLVR